MAGLLYSMCIPIRFFLNKGVKVIGKSQEIFSQNIQKNYSNLFYFEGLKKILVKLKIKRKNSKRS